jgi:hypothetical protein
MGPRAILDVLKKEKFIDPNGNGSPDRSARSLVIVLPLQETEKNKENPLIQGSVFESGTRRE